MNGESESQQGFRLGRGTADFEQRLTPEELQIWQGMESKMSASFGPNNARITLSPEEDRIHKLYMTFMESYKE